jgi:hypothetical protein
MRIEAGYAAFRKMLLYNPLTYFFLYGLLTERQFPGFHYRKWLAMALVLLFSPLMNPVGEAVYDWIAKNRHRIPGGRFCPLPLNFPDLHAKAGDSISVTPADESSSAGPVRSIGRQQ